MRLIDIFLLATHRPIAYMGYLATPLFGQGTLQDSSIEHNTIIIFYIGLTPFNDIYPCINGGFPVIAIIDNLH